MCNETTSIDPQDQFILDFLTFLHRNFQLIREDQYRDIHEKGYPFDPPEKWYTAADCLDLFKKEHIPALPHVATDLEHRIIDAGLMAVRRDQALFEGFLKLQKLMQGRTAVACQDVRDILLEVTQHFS